MRVLRYADYAAARWPNGKGVVRSIVEGDGWQARLADIDGSVPFSDYRGRLRHFAIVSGGVVLRFASGDAVDCSPGSAIAVYPGAPAPFCELVGMQPARAFNLIIDPDRVVGAIERVRVDREPVRIASDAGPVVAILVQAGSVVAFGAGARRTGLPVCHLDALAGIAEDGVSLQAPDGESIVLVARAAPR
jgi:environmental stress-induced protein Ves